MSCLATKQVELCNCSEPLFPINSSAGFSLEQSKFISLFYLFQTGERIGLFSPANILQIADVALRVVFLLFLSCFKL